MTVVPAFLPAGQDDPPAALHLPVAALEELTAPSAARPSLPALAHAPFALQPLGAERQVALAGPLSVQPLASLWPDPRRVARNADGVLLLHLSDGQALGASVDEDWLLHNAPAWRLATTLLRPALLVLRLDRRHGCTLSWRSPFGRWHPVQQLVLPGSRQRTVNPMSPDAAGQPSHTSGRDSRQRGGLGAAAHARLQQGTLGLVGLGRTGSAVAASATRLGWRVLGLDPDVLEDHNFDADFLPLHEGWPKARALQKSLGPIARPGAAPDLRALSVDSPAAGALLAHCDLGVITMVDNLPSLVWAAAWALATLQVHVCVATGLDAEGGLAEIEIRVLLPARGCPICVGGLAAPLAEVRQQIAQGEGPGTPMDFRQQRPGSVRSISVTAGHLALRALEQVVQGRLRHSLFRRLREAADGGLAVQDQPVWRAPEGCPFCRQFQGVGTAQVTHRSLLSALDACIAWQEAGRPGARQVPRPGG